MASSCVAIGAVSPTAIMRRTKPRRDRPPVFTLSIRPRNSRSFMAAPFLGHPSDALAILQDACNPQSQQAGPLQSTTPRLERGSETMAWLYLVVAGLFEIGWPLGLKKGWTAEGVQVSWVIFAVVTMT